MLSREGEGIINRNVIVWGGQTIMTFYDRGEGGGKTAGKR